MTVAIGRREVSKRVAVREMDSREPFERRDFYRAFAVYADYDLLSRYDAECDKRNQRGGFAELA